MSVLDALARHRGRIDLVLIECEASAAPGATAGWIALMRTVQQAYPWIPVIGVVVTAAAAAPVVEATRAGARDFVRLPLNAAEVRLVTETHLRPRSRTGRERDTDGILATVTAFVEQHFDAPISASTAAKIAGLSRWYFCRIFRKRTGTTFGAYVRAARLRRAVELLRGSQMSMTAIAHEVGFYDLSHFERTFRRAFGCAPSEFSQRGGGAEEARERTRFEPRSSSRA